MSNSQANQRFICSFCEHSFAIHDTHIGRCVRCTKCQNTVWIYPNRTQSIDAKLTSSWRYKKLKFLVTYETIGPIDGEEFVALSDAGKLPEDMEVCSAEFTGGEWIEFAQLNLELVRAMTVQRRAESQRLARAMTRRVEARAKNRAALQRAIVAAVADGRVALKERQQLLDFAGRANIPASEVESLLANESESLVNSVIEEAIEDGVLEPHERQRIGDLAHGLGVTLKLSAEQENQLFLCDLAYKLAVGQFTPDCKVDSSIGLGAKEYPLCVAPFEWYDVTPARRPIGISLGDGNYLKSIAVGECVLTNKRVMLVAAHSAKKFTLSSAAKVTRYSDGVFFNRSSGKSVFLKYGNQDADVDEWAMLAVHAVSGEPVLGIRPREKFVPDLPDQADDVELYETHLLVAITPRFTFRVVGDHVGNRSDWIDDLGFGDPLSFVREPSNRYDHNAVAVLDRHRRQLGYLKREVAEWFAPMLDSGRQYRVEAYRKPHSGGLITGVYEID